jgi:hypothetical protein
MKRARLLMVVVLSVGMFRMAQAANIPIESRTTSWDNNSAGFVAGQAGTPGKLEGDATYTPGMWSYDAMNYALPGNPSSFAATGMTYLPGHMYGNVFCVGSSVWSLPLANSDTLIHHWGTMGGNNYGAGLAFNNVLGSAKEIQISGSYTISQNQWGNRAVDSWIYKKAADNRVSILFENHQVLPNPNNVTVALANPVSAILQPGEQIFVVLGGQQDGGSGDHYRLYDGGLSWSVVPEPATLGLMSMGLLGLLRRRK